MKKSMLLVLTLLAVVIAVSSCNGSTQKDNETRLLVFDAANGGLYYYDDYTKLETAYDNGDITKDGKPIKADEIDGLNFIDSTLAFDNFSFITENQCAFVIVGNATIDNTGTSTLKSIYDDFDYTCGIDVWDGSLNITGSGTLNIIGGTSKEEISDGLFVESDLTIEGSVTVNANGGNSPKESNGIYARGFISMSGKAVTAIAGNASNGNSVGIYAGGGFVLENCEFNAKGDVYAVLIGGDIPTGEFFINGVNESGGLYNVAGKFVSIEKTALPIARKADENTVFCIITTTDGATPITDVKIT